MTSLACPHQDCKKYFTSKGNLNRHRKTKHQFQVKARIRAFECNECLNIQQEKPYFRDKLDFISHIQSVHHLKVEEKRFTLENQIEFDTWLKEIELTTASKYTIRNGKWGGSYQNYGCNRHGEYQPTRKENGQLFKAERDYFKVGKSCPASITVTENPVTKKLNVHFIATHFGHTIGYNWAQYAKVDKNQIDWVEQVASVKAIEEHDYSKLTKIKREYLRELKSSKIKKITNNDVIKTERMIKRNPDDFLYFDKAKMQLAIMTSNQVMVFQKLSFRGIMIVTNHGVQSHNLQLTTVMVFSVNGNCFPVAYLLTSIEPDTLMLSKFFDKIKERIGIIKTDLFISDSARSFYNAWIATMGEHNVKRKTICIWQILQVWLDQVPSETRISPEAKKDFYSHLRKLFRTLDRTKFNDFLVRMYDYLSTNGWSNFSNYFQKHYEEFVKEWAEISRNAAADLVKKHLESLESTFKPDDSILHRNISQPLDVTVESLLKLNRVLALKAFASFERVNSKKTIFRSMKLAHSKAFKLLTERTFIIHDYQDNSFQLYEPNDSCASGASSPSSNILMPSFSAYTIKKSETVHPQCGGRECNRKCLANILCKNKCFHDYVCSCEEYTRRNVFCHHLHYLFMSPEYHLYGDSNPHALSQYNIERQLLSLFLQSDFTTKIREKCDIEDHREEDNRNDGTESDIYSITLLEEVQMEEERQQCEEQDSVSRNLKIIERGVKALTENLRLEKLSNLSKSKLDEMAQFFTFFIPQSENREPNALEKIN